ncbi:MAG TPA: nickel/cobalt efflux transporter [Burkholderiaceae bacterium]|jgi:ABC-type nickel/cobalt efflux system permease component RcnA|nr:nickel/cobalt efflux transporter [Burkholderiaceae bacterium]
MTDFHTLLAGGNAWLFLPSAILLGALHGLEPGHSKTMMAAFIVAVRGTITQAVLLGLAATVSHTAIVWLIALGGMYFGQRWSAEASEPWMQLISAVLIVGVALWMLWRTSQDKAACFHDHGDGGHDHDHDHDHGAHGHAPAPALARVTRDAHDHAHDGHDHAHHDHADHDHAHGASCGHDHGHDHAHAAPLVDAAGQDAHARAHAADIQRRFAGRDVTTGQIVMFGLTGGLIPCPASITVLLLCLQLKRIALGATLVLGFSVGLALTMVASGVVAAFGVRHLSKRMSGGRLSALAAKAPYFSGGLILLVGLYVGWQGLRALLA